MSEIILFFAKRVFFPVLVLIFSVGRCDLAEAGKVSVVTSIFPLYDFTSQVGGDLVDVKLLLPPGVEAHGFSPTPHDMITISKSDLFLYLSNGLEPWALTITSALDSGKTKIVEIGKEIFPDIDDKVKGGRSDVEGDYHEGHRHPGRDPHIWLDPRLAVEMVKVIAAALSDIDPGHAEMYSSSSRAYIKELSRFDRATEESLKNCRVRVIVSGGHFAFGSFAERYDLTAVSPFKGYSPSAQPSPRAIARLVKIVRKTGSKVIFHEELIEPKVARIVAGETGGHLLLLHGVHNVSKDELQRGETYLSLMERNVQNLRQGLQCQ
ncbi:MAG: zinc ABC transporter substrate-binding protein [Deltaproteobacteria bacterium]|nr:zinc ABC transporter substrate-binding protein [Deltaproteobacteria bacterium]MBW2659160.1 zinc ABC transporter substrate-binding protein [Deltaproteobacteria bacterium]